MPRAAEAVPDIVGRWKALRRSIRPLRTIASKKLRGPYDRAGFLAAIAEVCDVGEQPMRLGARSAQLWRLEKVGFSYCRDHLGTLNDPAIEKAYQPILHVGLGIAATEAAGFSASRIGELIDDRAHPDYRFFPYESVGCIWGVYASPMYRRFFEFVSQVSMPKFALPSWAEFSDSLSPEIAGLMAHGYGRTIYFKQLNLGRAINFARAEEGLHFESAVQGIAFAYAILNYQSTYQILEIWERLVVSDAQGAFGRGLVYAIVFREWAFPGFIELLATQSEQQSGILQDAVTLIADCHQRCRLLSFGEKTLAD